MIYILALYSIVVTVVMIEAIHHADIWKKHYHIQKNAGLRIIETLSRHLSRHRDGVELLSEKKCCYRDINWIQVCQYAEPNHKVRRSQWIKESYLVLEFSPYDETYYWSHYSEGKHVYSDRYGGFLTIDDYLANDWYIEVIK